VNHNQGVARGQLLQSVQTPDSLLLKKQLQRKAITEDMFLDDLQTRKQLYHSLRLVRVAKQSVLEKSMPVVLAGDQAALIQGILTGDTSIATAVQLINKISKELDSLKNQLAPVSRKLEERFATTLSSWLWEIRKNL
jgi:hypothetical protein